MKRFAAMFLVVISCVIAGNAFADINRLTQNEFATAESLEAGLVQSGVHFTLGEDYQSYYPAIRYGLGALLEVGLRFGATSADLVPQNNLMAQILNQKDDKLAGLVGVDLKYQLIKEAEGVPLDMAIDLGYDATFISGRNIGDLSFSTIFSKGFSLTDRGYKLTPYGGIEMSALYGSYYKENDTSVYAFAGVEWKVSERFMMMLEVKGGENLLGGLGIRFEY